MDKSLLANKIESIYLNNESVYKSRFAAIPIRLNHKNFVIEIKQYTHERRIHFNKIFISITSKQSIEIEKLQQMMQCMLELIFVKTGVYFETVENSEKYYINNQLIFTEVERNYWYTYENMFYVFQDIIEVFDILDWQRAVENWLNFTQEYSIIKDVLLSSIYTKSAIEDYTFKLTIILESILNFLVYDVDNRLCSRIEHFIKGKDVIKVLFENNKKIKSFSYKITKHRNTFAHAKFDSNFYFKGDENEEAIKILYKIIRILLIEIVNKEETHNEQ